MKKILYFFVTCSVLLFLAVSCDGKRPENGILEFDLSVRAIQKNAQVEVYDGEKVILSGKSDETGEIHFGSVRNIGDLKVKVCGGSVTLVSSNEPVAWNGCSERSLRAADEENIAVVVDFLSSFIEKYRSETSMDEWFTYLDITADVFPELQNSLTDASKRWLWQQAFVRIAETVSNANGTQPETQFSTENLLNLLYDDLTDDNVINGSTCAKFGSAAVSAAFMKGLAADFLSEASGSFSAAELKEWSEKIRNSDAKFLGGEEAEKSGVSINIEVYPEGSKGAEPEYFSGAVIVEADAKPESMIVSLDCFADGEKLADNDEKPFSFRGSFDSENIEDDKEVIVRCEASNGIMVKTAEKTIVVNNEAPSFSAAFYRHGTLDPTATESNPARNSIDIKVEALHKRYAVEEIRCSIEGYQIENQSSTNYQYKAVVETEKLPDGKNLLECSAFVNKREYKVSLPFYTKNTVSVKVRAYITNPLTGFDSVSVSCGGTEGKPKDLSSSAEDEIEVKLGQVCSVTVSGGSYEPVVSESGGSKKFGGTLSAVFIPVTDDDIVVTPLTTVGAYIFKSRKSSGDVDDEELLRLVSEHLSMHLSYAFEWKEEPSNTNAADSRTKYYVLLSGLEYLAYFMETNIGSEHGIYDVSNIMQLLQDDYKDLVFDGKSGERQLFFGEDGKKTELDPNFFRYYYALSVKRFLTSSFNETIFTQLGTVVGNIASNSDQFLFPAESVPIPVDSAGPVINSFVFSDLFESENEELSDIAGDLGVYWKGAEQRYDFSAGIMPHFAKAFLLKFVVTPQEGTFTDLGSVTLNSLDPDFVFRIKRVEPQNPGSSGFSEQSTGFVMLAEYFDEENIAMEKQIPFSVSAQDIAYNSSETEITVFLDNKKPVPVLNSPEGTVRMEDVDISWSVSDSMLESVSLTVSKWEEEEVIVFEKESDGCTPGECSVSADEFALAVSDAGFSGNAADGLYKVTLSAKDHSGNRSVLYSSFVIDTTPPAVPSVRVESDGRVLLKNSIINKNYFTASLAEPDEDVAVWALRVSCSLSDGSFSQDKTGGYAAADESLDFFNLLTASENHKYVECKGFVSVCDEVGNCTNKDFCESAGSVFIDNQPPRFISYDTENSIFTECIVQNSSFIITKCLDVPNCNSGSPWIFGNRKPQILFSYGDNFSDPEKMSIFIQSSEAGWVKNCSYIPNVSNDSDCNCNKFYCSLEGSVNGINNFTVIAYDEVGNRSEHPLTIQMDFAAVEPLKINLTETFFTSKAKSNLWWETKSGVSYKCTITKQGNTVFSADCSNNSDILPSMLSGSGYYTVSVESSSASTQRTDVAEFKFFDMSDFALSLETQKGQFLYPGETFKVKVIADSGNMAEISKIELYLYGRYLNGVLQENDEKLVVSRNYPVPLSSLNNMLSVPLSVESNGQFRNIKADVTFRDSSHYVKRFTRSSSNAFLYCLLASDENPDSASVTFRNKTLNISFDKPSCIAADDYTLSLNVSMPSACEGRDALETSVSVAKNSQNNFSVKGDFVFFKDEKHSHSFDCGSFNFCQELEHTCAVRTHNFAPDTNLKIVYGSGKTFTVSPDSSVQCSRSETEIVFYDESGDYGEYDNRNCKKCVNKMSSFSNCFGGIYKQINLE